MPRVSFTHSSESDGFNSVASGDHAVFHFFDDCGYYQRVMRNRNHSLGIGRDRNMRRRIPCLNCLRIQNRRLYVPPRTI